MKIKQETLKEVIRNCTEIIMLFLFSALSAWIAYAITGSIGFSLTAASITGAQIAITNRIDRLERNLLAPKTIVEVVA